MGKARDRLGMGTRIAADVQRDYAGQVAARVAGNLRGMQTLVPVILKADDTNGLSDAEIRVVQQARKDISNARKRMEAIAERCTRG